MLRNRIPMKRPMMRVLQLHILQTLVFINMPVTDYLDLRLVRDGLQIRVQDAPFAIGG